MKNIIWWVVALFIVFGCLLPLGLYFSKFSDHLSGNDQHWSNFGGFWAPFVAISNSLAIIIITISFQRAESERNATLERPYLAIMRTKSADGYQLVNIGKGAALSVNTLAASQDSVEKKAFLQNRICYSLRSGDDFTRPWLNGSVIIAEYTDIFNKKYYSLMQNDQLHLFDGNYKALSTATTTSDVTASFQSYMKAFNRPDRTWP
jgi:hypothetical protein